LGQWYLPSVLLVLPIPLLASTHVVVARFVAESPRSRYLLVACGVVLAGGILGLAFFRIPLWASIVLAAPLYQFAVVRYSYRRFVRRFHREPVDVVLNFDGDLKHDRSLVMGYAIFGILVPMSILGWSVWSSGA
jgi:hypothetical protein